MQTLTPAIPLHAVLNAYRQGYFPMGDSDNPQNPTETAWFNPPMRALLPIDDVHVSRRLARLARQYRYEIRVDTAFDAVIAACAAPTPSRPGTWINDEIRQIFTALHRAGHAHSLEVFAGNELVGGIYGLALQSAFCAESMFSRVPNASKIALLHLCARLKAGGFQLLDCQILNAHTAQFGAFEIPRDDYLQRLGRALRQRADFHAAKGSEKDLILDFLKKALTIS